VIQGDVISITTIPQNDCCGQGMSWGTKTKMTQQPGEHTELSKAPVMSALAPYHAKSFLASFSKPVR